MTSNTGVFDISVILVPHTKIFTCDSVLLWVDMYAYTDFHVLGKKPQQQTTACIWPF